MFNYLKELKGNSEEGFTLTELIVVIVIIGILAAIAVPMYLNNRKQAIDAQTESNVKSIASTADRFFYENPKSTTLESDIKSEMRVNEDQGTETKIFANADAKGYCVMAWNESGGKYSAEDKAATFDSSAGGLGQWSDGCEAGITGGSTGVSIADSCPSGDVVHKGTTTTGENHYIRIGKIWDQIVVQQAIEVSGSLNGITSDPTQDTYTVSKGSTILNQGNEEADSQIRVGQGDGLNYIRHADKFIDLDSADASATGVPTGYTIKYNTTDENGMVYTASVNTSTVTSNACDDKGWKIIW